MNKNWLLSEFANPMQVVVCGDPAEALARLARLHGCLVLDLVHLGGAETDPTTAALTDGMVEHAARAAFRFAIAADDMDRREELQRQLDVMERGEPDPVVADEPEYMALLRKLAEPGPMTP
jgi:hypothetical protein